MKRVLSALVICALLTAMGMPGALASPFDEDESILRLVNKDHKITKNYVPELAKPAVPTNKKDQAEYVYMRPEAAEALEGLFSAAQEAGHTLLAVSGYRSYFTQKANYDRKVKKTSVYQTSVAPAGASEHQLGLAMDLVCASYRYLNTDPLVKTKEFQWLYQHCYQYGFALRYTKEWKPMTGFTAEAWHFRYLGVAHASALTWLHIPYETYVDYARELPDYVLEKGNAYLLFALLDSAINGDGCLMEEMMDADGDTEAKQLEAIAEMTAYCLPEGVALEDALSGVVEKDAVPAG